VGRGANCRAGSADIATKYNPAIAAWHRRSYTGDSNSDAEHGSPNAGYGNTGTGGHNHSRDRNPGNYPEHDSNSGNGAKHQSDAGNSANCSYS
jgi:hypothetical protein